MLRNAQGLSGVAPAHALPGLDAVVFQDPERGRVAFSRVAGHVSAALAQAIPALLSESPDPDSALLYLDRLVSESGAELVRLLERHHFLAHYAIVVFGYSHFLAETLLQNTDVLQSFLREKKLDRSLSREEFQESLARFRSRSFETDVSLLLARFKRREFVRIMLRDVLKLAPLAETTAEIAALADVLIGEALRESESVLQRRFGLPQHLDVDGRLVTTPFSILSLGKLGGNELNYSSDVDLLYVFGDGEAPATQTISNQEYFVTLAQNVTEILSRVTREGPVFRIDMRLRPQGHQGELAVSLAYAQHYYANVAQDWERQALIKMRHSAGDAPLARDFIRRVQAHVYGHPDQVNFAAIETALQSRARMSSRRGASAAKQSGIDVKIDRGGIRDIEFLVQCLQRVYGGPEPWLRSGGTLFSLHKLHDKGRISGSDFQELTSAYEFLRHLEHRLQLRQGQQTHRIPASPEDLTILHKAMEPYAAREENSEFDFEAAVRYRMSAIAEIYQRIIHQRHDGEEPREQQSAFELRSPTTAVSPEASQQGITNLLAKDLPTLHKVLSSGQVEDYARRNLFRFLASALTTSDRYAAVLRNSAAVEKLLAVFANSQYLSDILIRNPEEISTLAHLGDVALRIGSGYLFQQDRAHVVLAGEDDAIGRKPASDPIFAYIAAASDSYAEKLALLRQHHRRRVFASGAKDITELREVYQSLGTTTAAADDAINAAFQISGSPEGLAILALGRLGTREFDLLSDADVLFVAHESADLALLQHCAQQIIHTLAAHTREGMVFPVDNRLRPHGGQGDLLVKASQLRAYFQKDAQPWEALVYSKLRFIAGSPVVAEDAIAAASELAGRFRRDPNFAGAIREMRSKLENSDPGEVSFKTSSGAVYDIDFLCGYLAIQQHPASCQQGTLRERLWGCAAAGRITNSEAAQLDHAAELFRTAEHVARLVVGRRQKWLPTSEHARQTTEKLTSQILGYRLATGLDAELEEARIQTRRIYDAKLGV